MTKVDMKIKVPAWIFWVGGTLFILWLFFFKMIAPGYIGVEVNLFGEAKGAAPKELRTGMHWIAPWKKIYKFPAFEQNLVWDGTKSFTFQTAEGLNVNADIGMSYHLEPDKIPLLFDKYRKGIDEISDVFVRNYARDEINKVASRMTVEELYGTEKQTFIEAVQWNLRKSLAPVGICIDRVYLIGTLHFPQAVVAALNSKIEATQRAQQRENELREARAQAEKDVAKATGLAQSQLIKAKAEAESNAMLSQSITAELLMLQAIQAWDGKLPMSIGAGGFMVPNEYANLGKK